MVEGEYIKYMSVLNKVEESFLEQKEIIIKRID